MYIQPQTNIRILKDVPLDTTYEHTIYFSDASSQQTYFGGKQKYNLGNYTYQRVNKGVARVGIKADSLYDCNYMMFQNTAYGSKWFYAFITSVEFVNNECSEITFELDVMQTWFFDYTMEYSLVEREHVDDDVAGFHIEPENVELGEYVFNEYKDVTPGLKTMLIAVMINNQDETPSGNSYNGVYSGCYVKVFPSTANGSAEVTKFLSSFDQKPEAVVGMYMLPFDALQTGDTVPDTGLILRHSDACQFHNFSDEQMNVGSWELDGYKPKNRKMFTYPYNFYSISNGQGSSLSLRYEFFTNRKPTWAITTPATSPIQTVLRPTNYKGCSTCNNETLTLSNYPMCSWSTDAFRAWLAQNSVPLLAESGVKAGTAYAMGGLPMAGASLLSSATNALVSGYRASIQADITRGNQSCGNNAVASGLQTFWGGRCSITKYYARMIDEYFTMFGYAIHRVKIPNRNGRPHWNYVKTIGCNIVGSVPADDMRKICNIYDAGVTFWKNGDEIGNYSLDNTI